MDLGTDVTVDNAGAVTIADNAVSLNKIADGSGANDQLIVADASSANAPTYMDIASCGANEYLKYTIASGFTCEADAGASGTVASIAGATGAITLANSITSGVDAGPTFSESGGTITLNVPLASDAATTGGGLLTKAEYDALAGQQAAITDGVSDNDLLMWNGTSWEPMDLSADVTVDNAGAVTIANDAVDADKIADGAIDAFAKLGLMTCTNGQVLKVNAGGTAWECAADAGASGTVASLNSETGALTLATSVTSGTDAGPTVSASAGTVTVNIPLASDAASTTGGLLTKAEYDALAGQQAAITDGVSDNDILMWNGTSWEPMDLGTDVTVDNAGAVTIADNAINNTKMADDAIGLAELALMGCSAGQRLTINAGATDWECQTPAAGLSISGTSRTVAMFNATGDNVADSVLTQDATDDGMSVAGNLSILGELKTQVNNAAASTTINFNDGNIQYTSANCGAFTIDGMDDGSAYTLVVQGASAGTCVFTGAGDNSADTVKLPPGHGASTAGTHTIYTFIKAGTFIYASYVKGY